MTTTSPVLTPTSVQPRDSRKCLFQSPTDTTTRKELPGFVTPLGTSHILSQKRNRRVVVFSPLKGTNYKSPPKKKRRQPVWTQKELCSLIEFVALHKDLQSSDNEWPAMNADNIYWTKASDFIKQTCGSVRSTISCRAKIVNHFRITYSTIDEAEEEFLINYEESSSTFDDSGFIQTPKTPTTPATSISTVTDGEFNSLRSQGDTGPLHIWQLIHDSREAVRKMSKLTLISMLTYVGEDENGNSFAQRSNDAIPGDVIVDIKELQDEGLSFQDSIVNFRRRLIADGYEPYPFRKDTPESYLDMLRTIVATYIYRDIVLKLKQEGRDFTCYLYVPEVDPATNTIHYERGDHNHILKRMATSTRECKNVSLDPEAFDKAMMDNNTGLTHAALTGQRPQSVEDAEKLLSYQVALSMEQNNFESEAEYVRTIAGWHESSDGRGLTQLQRSKFNYQMLNYILDDFMPWHREIYNFSYIDINRPMENLRGFTRETFIDITANIESQEHRRRQNNLMNYPEHPRASTTDDVECFFSMTRRQLGDTFTLKEFKSGWRKIVREFCKRLDPNIPFYYWTQNERFKLEHASFDKDNGQDKRLHVVSHNQREDSNIFTAGRSFLPARNKPSIRQRLFRLDVGLPPVPENLQHLHLR